MTAHVTETLLPFESPFVKNLCPRKPPAPEAKVYQKAEDISILYIMLMHREAEQSIRIIKALQDGDRSQFVVHVDGKVDIPPQLASYAAKSTNVFLMTEGRVNVTWGAFSVVQATLNAMSYGFYLGLKFDRIINLSGTTYPLATPAEIRGALSKYGVEDQLMHVSPKPNVPFAKAWHYFVECDNRLHRIARFGLPHGLPLRTGSQWFVISRNFAEYLLTDEELVMPYMAYARHIIIADENFFATMLLSSPYCHRHVNSNFLHVKFDKWEDEKEHVDESKCLQPDPRFCGRSPLRVTKHDVAAIMANPTHLFARKFEGPGSAEAMDEIDRILATRRTESEAVDASSMPRTEDVVVDVIGHEEMIGLDANALQAPVVAATGLW